MPNQIDRRLFLNSAAATGLTLAFTSGLPLSARAQQDYPSRPVRIVVGFPAGGGTDVFARALAQALSASVGQQFVVDNKAGAGGIVASQSMLQTPANGYTLLMGPTSTFLVHIPYCGSAPALTDVIAGQIPLMFDSIAASGPQVRSGKVKACRRRLLRDCRPPLPRQWHPPMSPSASTAQVPLHATWMPPL
jgi:tripartite-type tricarboxylate transporter receptor subunit TctC